MNHLDKVFEVSCEYGGKKLTIQTGKMARQANGAVYVSYGDTRVLVTACAASEAKPGQSFFPLTVEYAEKFYAAGKIPGSFLKREGRPTSEATLSARMIDRPIRPLFPEGFLCETQVIAMVMSFDESADVDVAASIGASAALHISEIPFNGPTAACRVGKIDGKVVINPAWTALHGPENHLELMVAGTKNAIMMVEGAASELPEEEVLDAILIAHKEMGKVIDCIEDLRKKCGQPKREFIPVVPEKALANEVDAAATAGIIDALNTKEKAGRYEKMAVAKKQMLEKLVPESLKKQDPEKAKAKESQAATLFETLQYNLMRKMILDDGRRIDGRDLKTIRPITVEAGLLPRAHGSSLFTRGETQVLSAVTLGTTDDEQIVDSLYQNTMRKYMLHYNFPPFSVGEVGRFGGQSRREIGHGFLAERAVKAILPSHDSFPYTLRIVCETLESNGSSSMGSVCSASMALMDAGVPVSGAVGGIAMGLIKEGSKVAVLSDILGDEDHLGDMDFKVAGTRKGVTGIQMDIKIEGVNEAIMRQALVQAREGRMHILGEMEKAIKVSNDQMSPFAPRITTVMVPIDKIREVIGSGGKVIRDIIAKSGAKIDINDDGKVNIATNDQKAADKAIQMIRDIIAEVEIGKIYKGIVKKIVDFGAFVSVLPNQEGLLHVSEIAHERVNHASDFFKEGDEVEVKVIDMDRTGKIRLSRKVLLAMPEGGVPPSGSGSGPAGGGRPPRSNDRDRPRPPRN